ncbi:ABC transporter substrate-binding protein [bacterium]|nr:ABC transporter substrate-binding protein [bacterium]
MKKLIIYSLVFFVIVGILLTGCGKKTEERNIKIGVILPLTGQLSTFGQSVRKGVELALEEVNREGGVLGKKVELIIEDDESKTDTAQTVVTKLLTKDRVPLIIGEVISSITLAVAPLCQRYKVPLITPSATNADVTRTGDYIFRTCFIDDFQGSALARFAIESLKAKRAGILKDVKSDYSIGLASAFAKTFKEMGGEVVNEQAYAAGDTDFRTQLTSIKASNPDIIFIPGYYNEVGLIIRQARELSIKANLLGGDGWDSPRVLEIAGASAEGTYYGTHFSPLEKSPQVQEFVSVFKQKYNEEPDALAALGYDTLKLVCSAIKRAGTTEGQKVRDELAQTKNFAGVTGEITIDENRNARKPLVILKIEKGKPTYFISIKP